MPCTERPWCCIAISKRGLGNTIIDIDEAHTRSFQLGLHRIDRRADRGIVRASRHRQSDGSPASAPHQLTRQRRGRLAVGEGHLAPLDRPAIAARTLKETHSARRKVVGRLRHRKRQAVAVDDVNIGEVTGGGSRCDRSTRPAVRCAAYSHERSPQVRSSVRCGSRQAKTISLSWGSSRHRSPHKARRRPTGRTTRNRRSSCRALMGNAPEFANHLFRQGMASWCSKSKLCFPSMPAISSSVIASTLGSHSTIWVGLKATSRMRRIRL
jgi:hypothetical protein